MKKLTENLYNDSKSLFKKKDNLDIIFSLNNLRYFREKSILVRYALTDSN